MTDTITKSFLNTNNLFFNNVCYCHTLTNNKHGFSIKSMIVKHFTLLSLKDSKIFHAIRIFAFSSMFSIFIDHWACGFFINLLTQLGNSAGWSSRQVTSMDIMKGSFQELLICLWERRRRQMNIETWLSSMTSISAGWSHKWLMIDW